MFRNISDPIKPIDMISLTLNSNITEKEKIEYCLFGFILSEE